MRISKECRLFLDAVFTVYLGRRGHQLPLIDFNINWREYVFDLEFCGFVRLEVCPRPKSGSVFQAECPLFRSPLPFVRWTVTLKHLNYWHVNTENDRKYEYVKPRTN